MTVYGISVGSRSSPSHGRRKPLSYKTYWSCDIVYQWSNQTTLGHSHYLSASPIWSYYLVFKVWGSHELQELERWQDAALVMSKTPTFERESSCPDDASFYLLRLLDISAQ